MKSCILDSVENPTVETVNANGISIGFFNTGNNLENGFPLCYCTINITDLHQTGHVEAAYMPETELRSLLSIFKQTLSTMDSLKASKDTTLKGLDDNFIEDAKKSLQNNPVPANPDIVLKDVIWKSIVGIFVTHEGKISHQGIGFIIAPGNDVILPGLLELGWKQGDTIKGTSKNCLKSIIS